MRAFRRFVSIRTGLKVTLAAIVAMSLVVGVSPAATAILPRGTTVRASVGSGTGGAGGGYPTDSVISVDGRYVAFASHAPDLVADDGDANPDVFRRDLVTNTTRRVSVNTGGGDSDGWSWSPSVSADGRYVAFDSSATDLVVSDVNGYSDVFVRDMQTNTTRRVSVDMGGGDGNDHSYTPAISADGRYVAFVSIASDLVADDGDVNADIFVRDMQTNTTRRISIDAGGGDANADSSAPSISADGRYVAFSSGAGDLVADDGDSNWDVFVRDLQTNAIRRVSVDTGGGDANGHSGQSSISADGRYVAFLSEASDLVAGDGDSNWDVFVRDLQTNAIRRVSVDTGGGDANGHSGEPAISADGRYVTFDSEASDLVVGDGNGFDDVFVRDLQMNTTRRISVDTGGGNANGGSNSSAISGEGRLVVFESDASDLVVSDANGADMDVFVRNVLPAVAGSVEVAGTTRYATAVAASKKAYPRGADTVVIATGENWPDALGGAALAGVVEGPLLLTKQAALPANVAAEIVRLGAKNAYILGGTAAVSQAVEDGLNDNLDGTVTRLAGATRYTTANLVAAKVISLQGADYNGTAFVSTGDNFPDALGASPVSASTGSPILLVKTGGTAQLPSKVDDAVILGGNVAVTPATETALKTVLGKANVARIGGATRYETAAQVAEYGVDCGMRWDGVGIATGLEFPDALSGGAMLGQLNSVLLLTKQAELSGPAATRLKTNRDFIGAVHFIGGTAAVNSSVRDAVTKQLN